jgi:toxin ParE1/3/4
VEDIEAITDEIAGRNPAAAINLVGEFVRRWELLAAYPYSGVGRSDILPGVRHLVVGNYLAFYRVEKADVEIPRVPHGRRDSKREDMKV